MATLADELLNDFEDSSSDGEGDQENGALQSELPPRTNGVARTHDRSMVLDGDEEEQDDEDEELAAIEATNETAAEVEDAEEAKAKVEKMQLGGVSDVRNVANLMKTLEPVLEVRHLPTIFFSFQFYSERLEFTFVLEQL